MKVLSANDMEELLMNSLKNPRKVYNPGFNIFSQYYNVLEGSCTDWTGYPVSGKTELLLEVLMNMYNFYQWRHLIYMPDAGSTTEVLQDLLRKYSGQSFADHYFYQGQKFINPTKVTEQDIRKYKFELHNAFAVLDTSKRPTPIKFWEYAIENKKELNIQGAVIDSWNYLKHDTSGFVREDKWLEDTLSKRNQLAENSGLHFHTIIHPTKPAKMTDGRIPVPTEHDMKGGSEWFNNAKSIILVHRESKMTNIADIYIKKAKPRIVGQAGMFSLNFDAKKAKYYHSTGMDEIYAKHPNDQIEPIETPF